MDNLIVALRIAVAATFVCVAFYAAAAAARRLLPEEDLLTQWCGLLVAGLWIATLGFFLLMSAGAFRMPEALLLTGLIAAGARASGYRVTDFWAKLHADAMALRLALTQTDDKLQRCVLLTGLFAALFLLSRVLLLPPLSWDSMVYHAVKAGMWVQSGQLSLFSGPGGWESARLVAGGGELLTAWAMLPFHGDALCGLVDWAQWLALGFAAFAVARATALSTQAALSCAAYLLFAPLVTYSVGGGDNDILVALALLLGLYFCLAFAQRLRPRLLWTAGMAFGVAAGAKMYSYPTIALLFCVMTVFLACRKERWPLLWSALAPAVVLTLALLAPWLWTVLLYTGYPFSPFELKIGGVTLGKAVEANAWYLERPTLTPYSLKSEGIVLLRFFLSPVVFSPDFGMASVVLAPLFFFGAGRALRQMNLATSGLLAAVLLAALLFYFSPSFVVVKLLWSIPRFFIVGFFVALVVSLHTPERIASFARCLFAIVTLIHIGAGATASVMQTAELPFFRVVGLCVAVACLLLAWPRRWRRLQTAAAAIAIVATLTYTLDLRRQARDVATANCHFFGPFPTYWLPAAALLNQSGHAWRIAVTSHPAQNANNWFMYMFFGSDLQNTLTYVPFSTHESWGPSSSELTPEQTVNGAGWGDRLAAQGVTHVMSFAPLSKELRYMREHPERFTPLWETTTSGLYRLEKL